MLSGKDVQRVLVYFTNGKVAHVIEAKTARFERRWVKDDGKFANGHHDIFLVCRAAQEQEVAAFRASEVVGFHISTQ